MTSLLASTQLDPIALCSPGVRLSATARLGHERAATWPGG
jgi:hypothetical protein